MAPGRPSQQQAALAEISQRHIRLLTTLHQVVSTIAGNPDIEREVQFLVCDISSRFNFSTIAIGVLEDDVLFFRGVASDEVPEDVRVHITQGICGRVAQTGVGELIDNVWSDPDFIDPGGEVERLACVPIVVHGTVWGVLHVEASADVKLGTEEFDVMQTLATSLGVAIERSREHLAGVRRLNQLAHLQHLAGRIAGRVNDSCDEDDILTEIGRAFGYSEVGLGVIRDGDLDVYFTYAALLAHARPDHTIPMRGLAGRVARTGEPVFSRDVRDEPDYVESRPETTQEICVPVRAGGTVVGVLNIEATDERRLDDSDLDILLTLGDHLGTAISNHLRIAELERRNQQLHVVDRVTSLIAGQVTIRDALPKVLAEIEGAFGYGSSGIGLIEGDRLNVVAVHDTNEHNIQDYFLEHGVSIETGVAGRVARTGEPAFIKDVSNSLDYLPTSPAVQYEICVPIRANGRTIGILNVETPASKPLRSTDLEILTTIATHLGMAFERSEAYESERRSRTAFEAIQRVAAIVSSTLDSDEALRRIVETLANAFGYPFVSISLIDGDRLDSTAWHGLPLGIIPPPLVLGEGVSGRVAKTGTAELTNRFTEDDERSVARADSTSMVAVPISCDGVLTGVLSVEGNRNHPLTVHDLEMMQTFAGHAGTTITNARRYERVLQLAMRDPITDLPNYRQFQKRLHAELARSDRHERPLALLVIDLDGFVGINDAFGQLAGDEVLRQISTRLLTVLRESDVLARYAGDEFVVILPETDKPTARLIAGRLHAVIANRPFTISAGQNVIVSLSIGIAAYPEDGATGDNLVRSADTAMYWVKQTGKSAIPTM